MMMTSVFFQGVSPGVPLLNSLTVVVIFFQHKHLVRKVKVFCLWQTPFFGPKCDEESLGRRTDRRTDATLRTAVGFFFVIYVAKHSYSYHTTAVWFCDVGLWDIYLYLLGWRTCVVIRLTSPWYAMLAYPFTLVWFANTALLILPPEAGQRQSEISPLATSETFTYRPRWRTGAGSPHPNGGVKGALMHGDMVGGCSSVEIK